MDKKDLGTAIISPDSPVIAGSWATINYVYTAGHPIDDTGYVKIAFRHVGDFGWPQFVDPKGPNYCTLTSTGDCRIEPRWDPKGHERPWSRALYLKIVNGYLDRGEKIHLVFGDKSQGSPGWQVQTFCVDWFEFKTFVDPIATYQFYELEKSPGFQIIPGKAKKTVCIAPSEVSIGKSFIYHVKDEDRWGNPVGKPSAREHGGFTKPSVHRVSIEDKNETSLQSNPIRVRDADSKYSYFWADFHGQSEETIGSNPIEKYFEFGRDFALLDILGHQGNDFQITDAFWDRVNQVTTDFYKPGKFVTFPGYEYSANTPLGGDRNVFFLKEGARISRSSCELLPDQKSEFQDSPTAKDLFKHLATQNKFSPFVFAHIGGRYANLQMHDPEMEVAIEIHSAWGTFEWLLEDAFAKGYRVGIVANSDGHKCRPGASYPGSSTFGSFGGLTCVLAEKLDREHIHEAITARRTYATTGNRPLIDLQVRIDDKNSAEMGQILEIGDEMPMLNFSIAATAPIESIEVRNGPNTIKTVHPYQEADLGKRFKIVWSGAEVRGRGRKALWDGWLQTKGSEIISALPINFWNPDRPLIRENDSRISWQSITTGGSCGVILSLEKIDDVEINVHTTQKDVHFKPESIDLEAQTWDCGGLHKQIKISRLPGEIKTRDFSFSMKLEELKTGDNPIFIKLTQEDGHMAWTSPVYLVKA